MRIKGTQVKAARALLGMKAAELAELCGLQPNTVSAFERGRLRTEHQTIMKMMHALETNGVRFTETGVELTKRTYYIEGDHWFEDLLDDINETLRDEVNKTCYIENNDDRKNSPEIIEKLRELKKNGIRFMITAEHGNDYMLNDPSCYRWITINNNEWLVLIFGNKVAFSTSHEKRFLVVRDQKMAEVMKIRFHLLWDMLTPVTAPSSAKIRL